MRREGAEFLLYELEINGELSRLHRDQDSHGRRELDLGVGKKSNNQGGDVGAFRDEFRAIVNEKEDLANGKVGAKMEGVKHEALGEKQAVFVIYN